MEGQNQGFVARLAGLWGRLNSVQRIAIVGTGVLALALVIYAGVMTQTPDYATLFSGLSDQDAASVVDKLKELKIDYRLAQGGTAIQVPQRQVYDARMEMAKAGLPKGSTVGFELFDSGSLNNLGMTDFMQRLQYQRALEGELARTIGSLDPVSAARVHIVVPEPNLFTSEDKAPTASIMVQLKPQSEMTRGQIQAVTHLVASSVEGLKPSNITLVDMSGNMLSMAADGSSPSSAAEGSTQMDTERSYERDLERRLQAMLDQAVGPNQSIVRVSATFNWDEKQTNSETYAPVVDSAGVVRSEQVQEEANDAASLQASGVPGADSNTLPTYPAGQPITNTNGYVKRSTTKNYEVSKVVQSVTQAPGSIRRQSVALLLSDKLPAAQATQLQSMVSAAAGIDTSRGDTVAVERIPFETTASSMTTATASAADMESKNTALTIIKIAGLLLAVVVLLRFARLTFRELSVRLGGDYVPQMSIVENELPVPAPAQQLPPRSATRAPAGLTDKKEAEAEKPAPKLPPPPPSELTLWREQLTTLAERRPELIADLIQSWLAEG